MTNKLLKWSRPSWGEGLHGTLCPDFCIYKDGKGYKLRIRDGRKRYDRQDTYIKIKTVHEGKLKAAEILRAELNK